MRIKRKVGVLLAVMALLAVTAGVAAAEDATVTVTGGSLSVTAANVALSGVTLDGIDQTSTSASGSNTWSATDARGTGVGWHLTIASGDFSDGGTNLIDISAADQEFKIQLLDANINVTAGNTKPTSSATALTGIADRDCDVCERGCERRDGHLRHQPELRARSSRRDLRGGIHGDNHGDFGHGTVDAPY